MNIIETIANTLGVRVQQVNATVQLLDDGSTVPFISRYRKEVTQNLSDTEVRAIHTQLGELRELEDRRGVILKSITKQEKLTPELEQLINQANNLKRLEDLYLPYMPKRRTKAQIAREAGLEPLAMLLWQDPSQDPMTAAEGFLNPDAAINDSKTALEGARQILMEVWSEDAELTAQIREFIWQNGFIKTSVVAEKESEGQKFADYFEYQEAIKQIPSHRALAALRGRRENILKLALELSEDNHRTAVSRVAIHHKIIDQGRAADAWLLETALWTWKIKLLTRLSLDLINQLRESAEVKAIHVFADNLKDLLMAAPASGKVTMGLDPGFRTGVKVAIVDHTGKLLTFTSIFPHPPQKKWDESLATLVNLCQTYNVELVSIGNGTASRETDKLATELVQKLSRPIAKLVISEAGASVYSASELAAQEFPDLDVVYRGAVSIARRLQDPLAELVKIDPKAIGVGQYQHDVNQVQLAKNLDAVVEDCVNAVGVDVNTASVPLLARVSGLNGNIAHQIVQYRDTHGAFKSRNLLKKVPRLGDKTFEQAVGFLRIIGGDNPLDASAVHPEAYPVIEKILSETGLDIQAIMGNLATLQKLNANHFTDESFGLPTVVDIIKELEKPGRDPRPEFKTATFKEGVETMADLTPGLALQGIVTNITHFGAFVDIGVHQDGLVHKSQMANHYIADPREIVKVGDIVEVRVVEVDSARKRIALSMQKEREQRPVTVPQKQKNMPKKQPSESDFAAALGRALNEK